ncbi:MULTISPECIES: hypothetical protein [Moorena]|uniref:WD40 repeat domain-containing protein n=1 Tax=Moorena TaxID=1155738 RepID=UPI000906E73A|nr:hypothetical protein [Moorena producens]NEP30976.1 hypothetical protein [Moorena sp. SIO3B2]NEP68608.1 hypothetical protein [Moorena sp. SIO3A5]NES46049.1 hypothetical protein [Moorena sp. SIO2C4]NET68273.1 hypothetical protein [Moorena sp. SIO1G6]
MGFVFPRIAANHLKTTQIYDIAISEDSNILVASVDKTVKLWDINSGEELAILESHSAPILTIAISSDGKTIASAGSDKTIKVWDVESRQLLRTLSGHDGWVWSVAISPDGNTLVSGGEDGTIRIWSLVSQSQ